jgi:hypothetical protein
MGEPRDPLDQPEEQSWGLAVPFVVCQSQGGPYDDDAFVAGFQCGQVDKALAVSAAAGSRTVTLPLIRTELIRQLELIAMNHGYPVVTVQPEQLSPDWATVTFAAGGEYIDG